MLVCLIYSCRGRQKERKAERKKKKKRTGRIVKSATVHRDSLTGNAERFWPLVVTAGWTSTDKTRKKKTQRHHFGKVSERKSNCD